jgi:hypothetical protein
MENKFHDQQEKSAATASLKSAGATEEEVHQQNFVPEFEHEPLPDFIRKYDAKDIEFT